MEQAVVITGVVEAGKRLGRRLGFPTANIRPDDMSQALPVNGVYAAAIWLEGEAGARPCMVNQGVHPTVPDGKPTIEANLLDFRGDLYGRRVRLEYLRFIRPERRFDGLEALTEQLTRDRRSVRDWLEAARTGKAAADSRRVREIEWRT